MRTAEQEPEYVVLLDDAGEACGTAEKRSVHTTHTPLHLAFSCWLLDAEGRTLVTRRAATKVTWPSIWTNSFCGHPAPGEEVSAAVSRRARQELGVDVDGLRAVLPNFRYTARMPNGIVENEVCPVFLATARGDVTPDPAEVAEWAWVNFATLQAEVKSDSERFSPWLRLQLPRLTQLVR